MKEEQTHLFSAQKADTLDSKFRRLLQNPYKILAPFVQKGMTVMDYGWGNGYFSIPLSNMVGESGKVYSIDIQKEMLDKLVIKTKALNLSNISAIKIESKRLKLPVLIDFAIAIYVLS